MTTDQVSVNLQSSRRSTSTRRSPPDWLASLDQGVGRDRIGSGVAFICVVKAHVNLLLSS